MQTRKTKIKSKWTATVAYKICEILFPQQDPDIEDLEVSRSVCGSSPLLWSPASTCPDYHTEYILQKENMPEKNHLLPEATLNSAGIIMICLVLRQLAGGKRNPHESKVVINWIN